MDEFDFKEPKAKTTFKFGSALLNCFTLLILIATLVVGAFFALIFLDPQSSFNPFPPAAAVQPPPTAASEPTLEVTAAETPTQAVTATAQPPTATSTVEQASLLFGLQPGDNPATLDASVFHPEAGCNFMGVAGQVFGQDESPVAGLQVHVSGKLNGQDVDKLGLTGAATQYGSGQYYEVQLANQPIASDNSLQVTLLNTEGQPISDSFPFITTDSCQANLILINFSALQ